MPRTAVKPPPASDLYETDFYLWTRQQAKLLREGRFGDLDLNNLIDEVESLGSSEKREIRNRLTRLIAHLLKWKYQPGLRGLSWRRTIREQRSQLEELRAASPSLRGYIARQAVDRYLGATLEAAEETGIVIGVFPEASPFSAEQVLDPDFYPEDPAAE
jgi:hypothetical protein